ncbi:class I SAM-dependent methyltransferase [Amycolatopsis rhabdoformis]|uniref:Class I SAM-dependent methyltransferase n=1 Tax=Amycolatopsis rhabdoformis TaxID=1448059 RepID=A0ABZ1HZY1_9PSEU|nr:class I SAM-dependent methyltransferase [Amycolatopsis rhabdoformis]WSE27414.1 class I SAM-dependent methyltransferase [Amycolatopsis rhabdoformis]
MTTVDASGYAPEWLRLREPADARARSSSLVDTLALPTPVVVRDLGCGTGSMSRWLTGRLPHPQRWILHDQDPGLVRLAVAGVPDATGSVLDVTRLTADDLSDTSLVTASALLDLFTADEIRRLVDACAGARVPALLTLSVVGQVALTPPHPLDDAVGAAFNAHQRRDDRLGPEAVAFAAAEFAARGFTVHRAATPWRLGAEDAALIETWFQGWVSAAEEENPGLDLSTYRRVLDSVVVEHEDLLALP